LWGPAGGTSAAALYEAERGNLRTVISDSVWAAYRRSLELGGKSANVGPGRYKK
jgi:pyrroline-5-carboxylate reductase